jgi:hypothetical protein
MTLPSYGKDFERSLDRGKVDDDLFLSFSRRGGLPKFLWGFLRLVFDQTSGLLLDVPDIEAIRSIRQLTLMFGKMNLDCTPERVRSAFDQFVQCEQDVRAMESNVSEPMWFRFEQISMLLFSSMFSSIDREIYEGRHVPKHGPGATADGLRANAKFQQFTWPGRLNEYFPIGEMLLPNSRYYENLEDVDILEPGAEIPVKVISVPKTQKAPRIIAIEPTAMQYAQQSVLSEIRRGLSKADYLRAMIGIQDQSPNQAMALKGSQYGTLATLDLSEASDRVSCLHVEHLLYRWPHLRAACLASRSSKADVPGHGVMPLAKFASMGSALTFPMEAMVFLTIVFYGIDRALNNTLSKRDVKHLSRSVRVYGDDIIVPTDYVSHVVQALQDFGLVVNERKSFWTGRFRESCGKEYYAGEDVSIVRCRQMFPTKREHAQGVISIVSLRNQLYKSGYWATVRWLDEYIVGVIRHFPTVLPSSPVLGRHSYLGFVSERTGEHLHNPLVRGYVESSKPPKSHLDGSGALLKYFLKQGVRDRVNPERGKLEYLFPESEEDHLERAGRPQRVDIKLRWCSAY